MTEAGVRGWPAPQASTRFYYGWVVLAVAAVAMVGTLPGRTQGLGLITEPLLREFGISRVLYAQINLAATLIGSLFCIGVGRLLDRQGSRIVLTMVALALGVSVLVMSAASGVVVIALGLTLTRGFGQSALSIVSLAMVGKWFRARLTSAMAVYSVTMSVGFMVAFPLVGAVVAARGWRTAWVVIGVALVAGLAPLAWILNRSTPEAAGLEVDGGRSEVVAVDTAPDQGATLSDALGSPAFWVFASASAMYGLVASGIGLFNESILGERGFASDVYYTALAVTAITGLAGNAVAGAYADRGALRRVMVMALVILGAGLLGLVRVASVAQVMVQAVAMGIGGGFVMVVFFSFWGRAYGRAHLGRIQAAAQAMTVLASALGPLVLAWCVEATGSYAAAFYAMTAVVGLLAVAAATVPIPVGAEARGVGRASKNQGQA